MEFVDIHGHYAWGIDDGIRDLEESKAALAYASTIGVKAIAATPHVISGTHSKVDVENFRKRIGELKEVAKGYGITVREGGELFLNSNTMVALKNGDFIPYEGTKYMLCEFDVRKELSDDESEVEDYFFDMKVRGNTPVIAHVERYFRDVDIDRVRQWKNDGYIIQVNSTSLLGLHGSHVKKNAEKLIQNNLVSIVASDTHRSEGRRSPASLKDAYRLLSKEYGEDVAKLYMYTNPLHILNNEEVEETNIKTGFFKKLFGR